VAPVIPQKKSTTSQLSGASQRSGCAEVCNDPPNHFPKHQPLVGRAVGSRHPECVGAT
jgi:hypothetical protein